MWNLYLTLFVLMGNSRPEEAPSVEKWGAFERATVELSGIEGIELREFEDDRVQILGEIHRLSDLRKIEKLIEGNSEIENKTRLSPELLSLKRSKSQKTPNSTKPQDLAAKAGILLEMIFVEIKKTALKRLGVRTGGLVSAGATFDFKLLDASSGELQMRSLDPIRAFLDLALQKGEAKIHSKQSLLVKNEHEAEFQAGGEFPIKIVSAHSSKVEYKPFGLFLKFRPSLIKPPFVNLDVHLQISDVDMGGQVDGFPMISKKELKTSISAPLDQMMALGGLVRATKSKSSDEIPGISSVPILGRLFSSEDFKDQKTEAYIFITTRKMEGPWLPSPDL
jgi:Flp pilus assembly secretin CpaC